MNYIYLYKRRKILYRNQGKIEKQDTNIHELAIIYRSNGGSAGEIELPRIHTEVYGSIVAGLHGVDAHSPIHCAGRFTLEHSIVRCKKSIISICDVPNGLFKICSQACT